MITETNLEAVRETVLSFLYLDIEETELSPVFVNHPIFESGIMYSGNQCINLFDGGLDEARKLYHQKISSISKTEDFLCIMRKAYYLTFLKYARSALSKTDFSRLLGTAWTEEEMPNDDINVSVFQAARWFRSANKQVLMNPEEYQKYLELPDIFTVYRGVTPGHNPNGLSWTHNLDKAKWFANRFGKGYIRTGIVKKENVLAYFSRRGEEEIVVSPKNLISLDIINNSSNTK